MAKSETQKGSSFQVELVPARVEGEDRLRLAYNLIVRAGARVGDDPRPAEGDDPSEASHEA